MNTYSARYATAEDLAVQALDHIPCGIVIVEESLKAILHNETAAGLFSAADGVVLVRGHLMLNRWETEEIKQQFNAALNRGTEDSAPGSAILRVERTSGRSAYQVTARPLCPQCDGDTPRHHGVWLLSIHDPEQAMDLPRNLLRDYYRMTDAEIEVCRQLFIGGSIDNVAAALGISRNTVKTHLQRIYAKCEVKSQSLLILRLTLGLMR